MTPREVLVRHSSRELTEWMAFFELEPWGSEIEDHRFGVVASTIANVHRDPKKRSKPYEPTDFFPSREEKIEEYDLEANGAKWREFISAFKGGA